MPRKKTNEAITPGQCGFRGCNDDRLGGIWAAGGSYMCQEHKERLAGVRAEMEEDGDPYGVRDRFDYLDDDDD